MTAEPSFTADRSEGSDRSSDLSSAFGRPATSSLRGLLPPRPRRSLEQAPEDEPVTDEPVIDEPATDGPTDDPATDEGTDDRMAGAVAAGEGTADEPHAPVDDAPSAAAARVPRPRSGRRAPAPTGTATATGTSGANRRWGTARVASREHVELLVLVALQRGPADGRELAARLRADSGGDLAPPPTTVQRTLHHLARHALVDHVDDTTRRRYRLTPQGVRTARARVRAWRAMRRAVDAVVHAAEEN
ncbi:PadR family transcriptional regulator [Actinomycetospora aeridis]|uniref:PadR family transcriptional regulator n=1 Tax=Actinomycetospora aeridis TaxID=3129231 RepID=A0ABU8N3W3_9PSEU